MPYHDDRKYLVKGSPAPCHPVELYATDTLYKTDAAAFVTAYPAVTTIGAVAVLSPPALTAMQIADTEKYLREKINKVNESLPSEHRINKIVIRETDFVRSPSMKIVREQNAK